MLVAVAAFALVSFANLPRVLHDGVYYSYLSHTGRYYQVLRGGAHAESMSAAAFLAEHVKPGMTVAAIDSEASILHYLSGCVIVQPAPAMYSPFAPRADLAAFAKLAGADLAVATPDDEVKKKDRPANQLEASLVRLGMRPVFTGKTIQIYERSTPPADGNAGAPSSRPLE
jgi:hypothetical protein